MLRNKARDSNKIVLREESAGRGFESRRRLHRSWVRPGDMGGTTYL